MILSISTAGSIVQTSIIILCSGLIFVPKSNLSFGDKLPLNGWLSSEAVAKAVFQDSYMRDYFKSISEDLNVGSPVYFVINDADFKYEEPSQRKLLCGSAGCDSNSLVQQITLAASSKQVCHPLSSSVI